MPSKSVFWNFYEDQLPYIEYVGKKGFCTDRPPFNDNNSIVREAILETGDMVYLETFTNYKYVGDKIFSLKDYEKRTSFKSAPLVEGLSVFLTDGEKNCGFTFNLKS